MVELDLDAELPEVARQTLGEWLSALLPRLDPDGRGRLAVRISTPRPDRCAVEIGCGGITAYVVDDAPGPALERAFRMFDRESSEDS